MTLPAEVLPARVLPAETREERAERIYARSEQVLVGLTARRVRRGPETLIGVLLGVCLAVGVVASIDLRRLNTPGGTAQTWTGAAVFGDCASYEALTAAGPGDPRASDGRSEAQRCADLQASTEPNRQGAPGIEIEVVGVEQDGDAATVRVQLTRRGEVEVVSLPLARRDGHWAVLLTDEVCLAVGCA